MRATLPNSQPICAYMKVSFWQTCIGYFRQTSAACVVALAASIHNVVISEQHDDRLLT